MTSTSPIAANVHQVGSTSNSTTSASRRIARTAIAMLTATRKPASASAARFCAFAWPYGWPRSAGRTATETAKRVRSAAARSVPECAASAKRPRLELPRPAASLIATRRQAAPTETSAVRRCGLIATSSSEVSAERLLALDRLEERLEVPESEAARAVALDHLEEERRAVLHDLREQLEQVALLVSVDEDPHRAQVVPVLLDLADALLDDVVVRVGRRDEEHAVLAQRRDRPDDVLGLHGDVLHARAAVELEVLLDLALPLPLGGLVDRELDLPGAVRHHLRHERRVLGRDVVVREVRELREAEDARVEVDPLVHTAELDVAHDVVDGDQPDPACGTAVRRDGLVPRQIRAGVLRAVHEGVDVVAVRRDRRNLDAPRIVFLPVRLDDATGAALHCLAVGVGRVGHGESDVADAVSLRLRPPADVRVGAQPARHHEADVALLEDVGGPVANARFGTGVRGAGEAVCVLVEVRGLLGVPDPHLEVVPPVDRHEVVFAHDLDSRSPVVAGTAGTRRSPPR